MISIVLEGIDSSGKSTLSETLLPAIQKGGYKVTISREGTTDAGPMIKNALGRKGDHVPILKTFLFAADRYIRLKTLEPQRYDVVIWDRYFYTAIAYRVMEGMEREIVEKVNAIFPAPTLAYYLRIPITEFSRREKASGKTCPYTEEQLTKCISIFEDFTKMGRLKPLDGSNKLENNVSLILEDLYAVTEK